MLSELSQCLEVWEVFKDKAEGKFGKGINYCCHLQKNFFYFMQLMLLLLFRSVLALLLSRDMAFSHVNLLTSAKVATIRLLWTSKGTRAYSLGPCDPLSLAKVSSGRVYMDISLGELLLAFPNVWRSIFYQLSVYQNTSVCI